MKNIFKTSSIPLTLFVLGSFIFQGTFQVNAMAKSKSREKRPYTVDLEEGTPAARKKVAREVRLDDDLHSDEDIFEAEYNEPEAALNDLRITLHISLRDKSLSEALQAEFQKRLAMEDSRNPEALINARDETTGETLLMWAAENGQTALCQMLMQLGADVDEKSNLGKTALGLAADNGCTSPCRALRSRGAVVDTHSRNSTPLLSAAKNNHEDICRIFAPVAGFSMNRANSQGYTPLFYAVSNNNAALCTLFIQHGALLNMTTTQKGMTPLMLAAHKKLPEIIRILLDAHASVNSVDLDGNSALMHAVMSDSLESAHLLLAAGARLFHQNTSQEAALHKAAQTRNAVMVALLLYYAVPWRADNMEAFLCSLSRAAQANREGSSLNETGPNFLYKKAAMFIQPELNRQRAYVARLLANLDGRGKRPFDYLKISALNPTKLDQTMRHIRASSRGPISAAQEIGRVNQTQTTLRFKDGQLTCSKPA